MEAATAKRRKKTTRLSEREIAEILDEAERTHGATCRPLIHLSCEQNNALSRLNEAVHDAMRAISGKGPSWMTRESFRPMG
jgi:hypothetical protein